MPYHGVEITARRLLKGIERNRQRRLNQELAKRTVNEHLHRYLTQINIEVPEEVYEGLRNEHRLSVDMIRDGQFFMTQDEYGRIHRKEVSP